MPNPAPAAANHMTFITPENNSPSDPIENPKKIIPDASERQSSSWDIRNSAKNYLSLVVYQTASAALSFGAVWLVTRYLGTEGYGGVVAVIAGSQIVQIAVNWTCTALARFAVEEFVESGQINRSFWARTIILLPNMLVFLAFSFLWLPLLASWLKLPPEALWYLTLHFGVTAFWLHVQHAMQGAKLPRLLGKLLAAERGLIFSILVVLVVSGRLDFLSAVVAYIVPPFIMAIAGLFAIRAHFSWRVEIDPVWLKKMLRFSIPLIPYWMIGYFASNYLDAIFISQYLTKADLGIYFVAYQIAGILMQFSVLAGSLLMPLFVTLRTNQQEETITNYLKNALPILTLAWGLSCVIFAILAAALLPVIFGSEMAVSSEILLILTICSVVNAPFLLGYAPFINTMSATYISLALVVGMAVTNVAGNVILIPEYGLAGSAWASALAYSVGVLVASTIVHYRFKLRGSWSLPAAMPAVLSLGYGWWTGSMLIGLALGVAAGLILMLWHRESVKLGARFLLNYRSWVAANPSG